MEEGQDVLHQIEYRWHDRLDLSPIACTMSQASLRGWDAWIRDWVRHPHVEGLGESLRYQIHSNGRAALAWRYEDWQAAEREDGTRGRPLVSRVLAGQASLLTPELAIVLCRTGLPPSAGPRPGQVTAETGLPLIRAAGLSGLVSEQAARLDQEAARQDGLGQVIASALSDQHTPLAVHVRGTYLLRPPGEGLQCLLLWGMWRIVWPLVGTAGRGWSFSTFEPPLGGDVDPATLPDILFRQTQDTPPSAPARPRKEIKSRPFDPGALDEKDDIAQLAGWLVVEYRERGGADLKKVITDWCVAEHSFQLRIRKVYAELCAKHASAVISGPASPFVSVSTAQVPKPPLNPPPAQTRPERARPAESHPLDAGAAVSSAMPSPSRDQGGPVSGASTLAEDQEVPGQQTVVSQADAEEVPEGDRDWDGPAHRERLWEQDLSGDQEWFEGEVHGQGGYTAPPDDGGLSGTADRDPWGPEREEYFPNPKQGVDPDYPVNPRSSGDLPYTDAPPQPPQPDGSPRPVAWDQTNPAYSERTWVSSRNNVLGQVKREGNSPQLPSRNQDSRSPAGQYQQAQDAWPASISDLLKQLPAATEAEEFVSVLQGILNSGSQPDMADRVKARREVSKDEWYKNIHAKFGELFWVDELAKIFQIVVIPDLGDPEAAKKIADWAEYAHPAIIAGLLMASSISGDDTWHSMMQILQPKLAYRWMTSQRMEKLWDLSLASQHVSGSGRGRFNLFRRN